MSLLEERIKRASRKPPQPKSAKLDQPQIVVPTNLPQVEQTSPVQNKTVVYDDEEEQEEELDIPSIA